MEKGGQVPDLFGKTAVVTGSNTGMGYMTACELAKMGAHVVLACRSAARGEAAIERMHRETQGSHVAQGVPMNPKLNGKVSVQLEHLDFGVLKSVVEFAGRLHKAGKRLDILVNNAGVMAIPKRTETADGFEMQMGINHFAVHLLSRLLLPLMNDRGRMVWVSSVAHDRITPKTGIDWDDLNMKKKYSAWGAYSLSKLGNVLDAMEFRRFIPEASGIVTYSLHPGVVNTELGRYMTEENSLTGWAMWLSAPFRAMVFKTPLSGASTAIRCASDPELGDPKYSGRYFSDCKLKNPSLYSTLPDVPQKMWEATEKALEEKLGKPIDDVLKSMPAPDKPPQ